MSSTVNSFVHVIRKHSKKCLAQKVGHPGLLHPIPMIQSPFNSSWVALQFGQEPRYTVIKLCKILHFNARMSWQNTQCTHKRAFLSLSKALELYVHLILPQQAFNIHLWSGSESWLHTPSSRHLLYENWHFLLPNGICMRWGGRQGERGGTTLIYQLT